jgi:receptor expression-enhancing protein 5/6
VKSVFLAVGFVVFVLCFIMYGLGASLVCDVVGIIYPAYMSYRTVEFKMVDAEKQWLSYWIIFGFVRLLDDTTDFLYQWIPFYYLFKLIFIVWLFYPTTQGASKIYERLIRPLCSKYESSLDEVFEKVWV